MIQINSMQGLGDNIYQRPIVVELAKHHQIEINSSWPQLYSDLPGVTCVMDSPTTLRTQLKNVNSNKDKFSRPSLPQSAIKFDLRYSHKSGCALYTELIASVTKALVHPYEFYSPLSLPTFYLSHEVAHILSMNKPIAVIRPATIRTEWPAPARNPDSEYLCKASAILRGLGWHVIVVADLKAGEEMIVGDLPDCDQAYISGQLSFEELMCLSIGADLIVGGVGWIVPFSYAAKQKAIVISGGALGLNAPTIICPPQHRNDTNVQYMLPDRGCFCKDSRHQCHPNSKIITDFEKRFHKRLERLFE